MSETITLGDGSGVEFDALALREALADADPDEDGDIGGRGGQSGSVTVVGDGFNDGDLLVSNGEEARFSSVSDVREALDEQETFLAYLEDELGRRDRNKLQADGLRFPDEASAEYVHHGTSKTATVGRSLGVTVDDLDGARISYVEACKDENGEIVVHVGIEDLRDD
jgi:hypothetical protein